MEDLSIRQTKRIEEIDYLRGFAILAVVAIHTSANFTQIPNVNLLLIINVIIDVFSHFAVPLFIFISGFALSIKYKGQFSQKLFLQKRAKSILPPYIIFSTIYILYNISLSAINGNLKIPSIMTIIFNFLTASSYSHLWYFALIIQFYIFYPYIMKTYEKFANNGKIFYFIFLVLITQQVWIIIKGTAIDYFDSSTYFNSITYFNEIVYIILNRVFFSHIFYFIFGIYVCQNYEYVIAQISKAKKWILPTIILLTGVISAFWINGMIKYGSYYSIPQSYFLVPYLLASIYYPFIFSILFILTFSIIKNKYSNYSKTILLIGRYSFGIYLIHALYIAIIVTLIFPQFGVDFNHLIFYPVLFISSLLLSYFSVYLISYLPYSEIIIGIKK
ncbi:hypothetical protein EO95_11760 [Methanosarcina sp. 1.H.T.1A.1]|uniref:acyltransferase n=1 Tax=Methanosarcina sp. 1.H.T.1A.1 TaxID=1483602 RepID=UPI0006227739|nr:acyltransferase [Methanosarcina sp. 1.H.T.1A.1]KKH97834.1 hypothetical protein EO95_11760 [Methanosarcina sp. 1.H.T.1A.1]